MKEVIDIIVVIIFVFFVAAFIIGFNKQQIQKHQQRLRDLEEKNLTSQEEIKKGKENDKTTTD